MKEKGVEMYFYLEKARVAARRGWRKSGYPKRLRHKKLEPYQRMRRYELRRSISDQDG
jgi:hypothetical protein